MKANGDSSWQQSVNTLLATWQVLNVPPRAICLLARIHLTSPLLSSPLLPARLVAFASSRIIPNYIEKASIACHCFWPLQCNFLAFLVNQNFVAAPGLQFTARPESFLPAISNNCLHLIAAAPKEWEDGEDGNGGHAGNSTLFI